MRAAFLSDVHGNLPALEAALAEAERRGAEVAAAAGDLVGGGPHPEQVVQVIRSLGIAAVRGNVDRKVGKLAKRDAAGEKPPGTGKQSNYLWTARQLSRGSLRWLRSLPQDETLLLEGVEVQVVHGSPLGDSDYVYPSITPAGLAAKLRGRRPAALVCGHSHVPFMRRVGGVLVVNCGSVGRPVDGDPRGAFAVLEIEGPEKVRASIVRFGFPVDAVVGEIERLGVPGTVADEYRRGVKHSGA